MPSTHSAIIATVTDLWEDESFKSLMLIFCGTPAYIGGWYDLAGNFCSEYDLFCSMTMY